MHCWALAPLALSAILEVKPVVFPAYESYKGIARYAPTPADYAAAIADRRFVMERLTYRSDGLDVYAYLYRPAQPPRDVKMPVVVFNRGSYTRDDFLPEVLMPGRRLAEQGYLVIAPMLRGSGGASGHDEMGGADLHDLFNVVDVVKALPYADPDRLFLYGESRGGIMCLLAAKNGFPARAMAVYGALTDLRTFLVENGPTRALAPTIWPGFPANEAEIVESRSAMRWPEKIGIPVLIMNGGEDDGVSPVHALQLATALEKLHHPYELKIFYGEKHVLSGRARERDEDAMRWFRRFDQPPPQPSPQPSPRLVPLSSMKSDVEVILGDPEVAGQPFVMRIRELPGTIIPPHSHAVDEHITVLEGTFFFAVADTFDLSLMKELKAGGYAFAPQGSTMFGASPDGAIVQVHGSGPFHVHWRDGYRDLDHPQASEVFLFRKGDLVATPRGAGTIVQGYSSGTHVQYEIQRSDGSRFLALQSDTRREKLEAR